MTESIERLTTQAFMLSNGIALDQDHEKAFELYRTTSDRGDLVAKCKLGRCYEFGLGVERDVQKAIDCYLACAHEGHVGGMFNAGRFLLHSSTPEDAIPWLERAIANGHEGARCVLGEAYERGAGVEPNLFKALELYREASERGESEAQVRLARCYREGNGVIRDVDRALSLLVIGCHKGNGKAWYDLGSMLWCDEIEFADTNSKLCAIRCFERAAELGILEALVWCGEVFAMGTDEFKKDVAKGIRYLSRAATRDEPRAMYLLAVLTARGDGVKKDEEAAFVMCRQAAVAGVKDAEHMLALLYERGVGTAKSQERANYWLARANKNGR